MIVKEQKNENDFEDAVKEEMVVKEGMVTYDEEEASFILVKLK